MDIYNSKPRKIRCISNEDGEFWGCDGNHHLLTIGKEYTLCEVEMHSWHTIVYLEEFPDTEFNSCAFEEL